MEVYLDYNATTPLDPEVSSAIKASLDNHWHNPSSSYAGGIEASKAIRNARKNVAEVIGSEYPEEEITFSSGGTEANFWAVHCAIKAFQLSSKPNKPHVITTNIEHPAMEQTLLALSKDDEIDVTFVPVSTSNGSVDPNDLIKEITDTTCLITVMMANNETGILQPIRSVGSLLQEINRTRREKGLSRILFHTDAAQTIGKVPVSVQDLNVDMLTIVGHKFYGPRIGALFHARTMTVFPLFFGGGQEFGRRPGTENTPMIVGLGIAAKIITRHLERDSKHLLDMKTHLREELKKSLHNSFRDNFDHVPDDLRLPNTLNASFKGADGRSLLDACSGSIQASTRAACHSGDNQSGASNVLLQSGLTGDAARGTLRLSVGRWTTREEMDCAAKILAEAYNKLYKGS